MRCLPTVCVALLTLVSVGFAQKEPTEAELAEYKAKVQELVKNLKFQEGEITLRDGLAKVKVPANFRYLDPDDADTVVVKLWGNPPHHNKPLGMLIPAEMSPADPDAWAVIITFEEDGYVKDNDANKINYDDLLKQMKETTRAASEDQVKKGYPAVELIGWAAPPRYDAAAKKLYWAKELKFGDAKENTLNYNIRMLGRRGVLVLNAVAATTQLKEIEQATPTLLSAVDFKEGHRYSDFNSTTDKTATYGLAALVAGGILAKTGLLTKIGVLLVKLAKPLLIGLVAIGGGIKKLFSRKQRE